MAGHILGEVLCASYVDTKYGRASSNEGLDFIPDTDWQFAYEEHEIVVMKKLIPKSPILCFMGRGVIDLPMEQIAVFVCMTDSYHTWDKFLVEIREVETLSESTLHKDSIGYLKHEAKQCLVKAKRDFVRYCHYVYKEGKYIQTCVSVDHPHCPPVRGVTRGIIHPGTGFVLEPYKGNKSKTLVSYLVHLDPKGLPPLIANRVLKRYPMSVHYLRQHLMQRRARQNPSHTLSMQSSIFLSSIAMSGRHYEEPLSVKLFTGKQPGDVGISSDNLTSISEEHFQNEHAQQQQIAVSVEPLSETNCSDDECPTAMPVARKTD